MRFLLSVILFMGTISPCYSQQTFTWNQRMVVTVETPEGPIVGSTVYEFSARVFPQGGQTITGTTARYGFRGEAAVLDLGEGRYIFALVEPFADRIRRSDPRVFAGFERQDRVAWLTHFQNLGAPIILREEFYPRFVTFSDIGDPLTADIFEAGEMAAVFGEGYAIASVTLEVVEAPMDVGRIEAALPWLFETWPGRLDGDRYGYANAQYPEANALSAGSFTTESFD